jgi:hypothetical protein
MTYIQTLFVNGLKKGLFGAVIVLSLLSVNVVRAQEADSAAQTDKTQELVALLSKQEQDFYMAQQLERSKNDPIAYLYYKGKEQGLSDGEIIALQGIMYCESHYNQYALNASSHASGLFQFLPSSWRVWGGGGDPFSIPDNITAAITYYKYAGTAPWVCPPVPVMPFIPPVREVSLSNFLVEQSKIMWSNIGTPTLIAQEQ